MKTRNPRNLAVARWTGLLVLLWGLSAPWRAVAVGYWTALANKSPDSVQLMLLLSDGKVMAANNPCDVFGGVGQDWYLLTPDISGGYDNGTWSTLASMHDNRLFYSSAVLPDGRVFVAGGEYGSGRATAEIYNPIADVWTQINPPASLLDPNVHSPVLAATDSTGNQGFVDSGCVVLANGTVLVAPVAPNTRGGTLIYNPVANTWSAGPLTMSAYQDEASWVKLRDDSILTIDPFGTNTERFVPGLNQWIPDQPAPTPLYSPTGVEMGPAFLLPDGRAFFLGGSGHTAYYTPSGGMSPGTWTIGPDIPNGLVAADSPAAMMVNGKILCAVAPPPYPNSSGKTQFPTPTSFYEFDPVANAFTRVSGPTGTLDDDIPSYLCTMLDLPDGTVLYCHVEQGNLFYSGFGSQLYVYHPDGAPLAAGKPNITGVAWNPDASLHLTGTLFNGISQGAAYGDDAQMDSNYPLARFINSRGSVWYGRTYNWSSTGVMTGTTPVSTEVGTPWYLPQGWYSLTVVANGISSDPVSFYGPVWVDFNSFYFPDGSFDYPYWKLADGVSAVDASGTIAVKSGLSHETMTISKPMTIIAVDGPVTIGN